MYCVRERDTFPNSCRYAGCGKRRDTTICPIHAEDDLLLNLGMNDPATVRMKSAPIALAYVLTETSRISSL